MKIYVVSRGYVPRMHFLRWYPHHDNVTVVTHTRENSRDIHKAFPDLRVVHTHMTGVVSSRNYICENLVKRDDWYIGIDDDIEGYQIPCREVWWKDKVNQYAPPPKGYATWRAAYRLPMHTNNVQAAFGMLRFKCIANGTIYGSFASQENPFFRARKWSEVKFAKSGSHVMQNTRRIKWEGEYGHDTQMSVDVVVRYGSVAVCNYIYPLHKMYGEGGLGKIRDRRPILDQQLQQIINRYPGLVIKAKGQNSALRFVRTSAASVNNWKLERAGK